MSWSDMSRRKQKSSFKTPILIIVAVVAAVAVSNLYLQSVPTAETDVTGFRKAPELAGIAGYINTGDDISLRALDEEDKVVLVDFWTYSCINCQRTTPYLNEWHEKYSGDGLVIVGVHSPEFAFEKDYDNVVDAVERFGIEYPVVQDNDFATWQAYENRYWPRKYLVDIDGNIRYDHIGEGAYEETERKIQELLAERAARLNLEIDVDKEISRPAGAVDVEFNQIGTPEIYFGYKFLSGRNYIGNFNSMGVEREVDYSVPESIDGSKAYLGGRWYMSSDYSENRGDEGRIVIAYRAKSVNLVAGGSGTISVSVDGEEVDTTEIDGNRLYNLVSSDSYGTHLLELAVEGNVRAYTFTFG